MTKRTKHILLLIIALLVFLIMFIPIFVMLPSMFKSKMEIWSYPWHFLPQTVTFDNFSRLAYLQYTSSAIYFFRSIGVTILVASVAVVLSLSINMTAAFAFARLKFPFKRILFAITILTMFIPGITILITSVRVVSELGMINTIWVLIIPGLANAYNIFFFRQFYLGFPKELDEAAKVDGATIWQIFSKLYIPMSKTPMVIIGATIFMGYYNSYLWPTLTISSDRKDLFQIMYVIRVLFSDSTQLGYGSVLAAAFVAMIPPLIIFIFIQKYIREGIAISGLK